MERSQKILITGCSSPQGIGFATARALAERGHRVHATVRDHANDALLRDGVEQHLVVHDLDLTIPETMDATLAAVLAADGSIDVLVNNAGYGLIGGFEQVEVERVRANFEANFFGTVDLIQRVLPVMRRQRRGHIVNVSTIFAAGLCPPGIGFYIASKAALETACQALAGEVADWDIRVTNYQPGPVGTDLSREWGSRLGAGEDPNPQLSDQLYEWVSGESSPELQSPAEVADDLAEFLCSVARPGLAAQSGPSARAYATAALHDAARTQEFTTMLAAFGRRAPKPQ